MNERLPFSETVRELRKSKRLSQNALAKIAGVSPRTIFGYEAGTTYPRTASTLNRLAEALGVTSEALADNTHPLKSCNCSVRPQINIKFQKVNWAVMSNNKP